MGIALHTVHALPTIGCPFDDVVDKELIAAERRLRSGHIHVESFKAANGGRHPAAVLCSLRSRFADLGEVVFTHGDYALPNVILDGGRWKGLIDWGAAGLADPHRDLMCAEKSLRRNLGEASITPFYQAYAAAFPVRRERIDFFWDLDQFDEFQVGVIWSEESGPG